MPLGIQLSCEYPAVPQAMAILEKIRNLGDVGQVVKVKDGYGRNFLIKFGKALRADKKNVEFVNKKK